MDNLSLKRFFQNECLPAERKQIVLWLLAPENDFVVRAWMKANWDEISHTEKSSTLDNAEIQQLWLSIQNEIGISENMEPAVATPLFANKQGNLKWKSWYKYAAVAVVIAFSSTLYIFKSNHFSAPTTKITKSHKSNYHNDIKAPQNNTSILVLEGGAKIYLDNVKAGLVATQNKISIIKNKEGEITYQGSATDNLVHNTIMVPKGSKIQKVILSDGSAIFLNAGTSITFPIAFTGKERRVSINGEGYFEVAKNKLKPFYVTHNDVQVKVLGTHFNVTAYSDESNDVKVTLLEGSVRVSKGKQQHLLKPGQVLSINSNKVDVNNDVDTKKMIAWKDEQFYFDGDDIHSIMNQVEMVYNVKVVYEDSIQSSFVAKLSRNESLSSLLQVLELTNVVHFKIDGDIVTVSK